MQVRDGYVVNDGYVNMVANLGTDRDKASHGAHTFLPLDDVTLETTYRSSPLARKIVDMPAEDACREWRAWQAEAEQISALEAEETRLRLQGALINCKKAARLWGGAALYMHLPGDPAMPVNLNGIKQGGLARLTLFSRTDLDEGDFELDPRKPEFGRPRQYMLRTRTGTEVRIHPSRLVVLTGEDTPGSGYLTDTTLWGDSVLQSVRDTVMRLEGTEANIASLIFEAKIDIWKIHGLAQQLETGGTSAETALAARMNAAVRGKGINGTLVMDAEDEWEQKTASFGGLGDIWDRFMVSVAAASSMPVTRLFGRSPAGLNATGESDIRDYYDRVRVIQTLELDPAMDVLNEALIRSALGNRPEEIHFNWNPLWQPSDKERAEVGKLLAETLDIGARMNAASPEALGETYVNVMTETGVFPGLEAAAEDFPTVEADDPVEAGVMPETEAPEPEEEDI